MRISDGLSLSRTLHQLFKSRTVFDAMTDKAEENKAKMDLKPNVEFVANNIAVYRTGIAKMLSRTEPLAAEGLIARIGFDNLEGMVGAQLNPEEIRRLLRAMPESLIKLSKLVTVQYFGSIPIPTFDENGVFTGKPDWVGYDEFPREQDHPSRILVGISNGESIYPTPIPVTVCTDAEAVKIYQTHVFLHEFFHTIDYPRRTFEKRSEVLLENDGERFTLQDIWEEFEKLYLSGKRSVSRYAETYSSKLNASTKINDTKSYDSAIGEQICESFVGYMLGIISNDHNEIDFKQSHPKVHKLIDKICRARVV